MTVNVRFSQHTTADGKKYLGGPLISGTVGVYSPTMTSTNAVFDEVLKQENIDGTKDYRCFYFQNNLIYRIFKFIHFSLVAHDSFI